MSTGERLGAIVIGGDFQGLGIVRSLGRHGIPVCVLDDEPSISRYSRYTTRTVRVPDLRSDEATVGALLAAVEKFGMAGWIVFPTRDETVATLSRHREQLADHVRITAPAWESVKHACDKRETYRLAAALGIPIPRTWYPESLADLAAIDAFPVVVKPAEKDPFVRETGAKAWRVDTTAQLQAAFRRAERIAGVGRVIVQKLVPGGTPTIFGYCAFFREGEVVAKMVVQYGRQHPADFGRSATYVESVELPEFDEPSIRFLRAMNYYGLVEIEYKHDAGDGVNRLVDVNARTWGYHALGARLGVDFPYLLYRDQLGEPNEPLSARPGVGWFRLVTDLPTALAGLARGRLGIGNYVGSMRRARCEAVFSTSDPVPTLAEVALLPHLYLTRSWRPARAGAEGRRG